MMTSGDNQDNQKASYDIGLVSHLGISSHIRCGSLWCVPTTTGELAYQMWSRMRYPTRFTLVQNQPPVGWQNAKAGDCEGAIYG